MAVIDGYARSFDPRVAAVLPDAARRVEALGARLRAAGLAPDDLRDVRALDRLPVLAKDELIDLQANAPPFAWPLERAFVSAEPLPPSLRAWLDERIAVVRQGYGTAETGNLGYECNARTGLHLPEDRLVQVCDPNTGEALWDGREGEVVVTVLSPDYPLVRFGTGDLSAFLVEPCDCGIPTPRIAGWLGRVGEAVKVRGMFLHPRQASAALDGFDGVERFRLVVDRREHRDLLRCEVVPREGAHALGLPGAIKERIRSGLRFDAEVVLVDGIEPDSPVIV